MNLNNLMSFINKDFPDYEIINIEEFGLPIFKKNVTCLATFNKRLSDVMEFTLKLMDLNYDEDTIAEMLALDKELIKHAIYDLETMDMVNIKTYRVTEEGKKYLQKNSFDTLKRVELPIIIDSYLGDVRADKNYISNRTAKNINLNTIKPLLDVNNIDIIEPFRIKSILKEYIQKNDSDLDVDLVGIISYSKKSTQFLKLKLAILKSPTNEIRFIIYHSNNKLSRLEQKIINADEAGIRIFKPVPISFFKKNPNIGIQGKLQNYNQPNYVDILNPQFFNKDNLLLDYVIPLINVYNIDSDWIMTLESYLKRNLKVNIKFVGESYPSPFFKNQVLELLKLKVKYKNFLDIKHYVDYEFASITVNNKDAYVDKIEEYELGLNTNPKTIRHRTLHYREEKLIRENQSNITVDSYEEKKEILLDITKLIKLSKELDVMMEECYGLNWLSSGQVLNQTKLLDITLANTSSKFSEFTKLLNSSFVEVLSVVGKEQGSNNYMFEDFKNNFQTLFKALNRLRVYRNSMQHNDLDEKNLKAYIEFVKEDLNGQFPEFLDKGYLHLQKHILQEILSAVENTIEELKTIYI
ncbi:serine/threonine protein kinase [Niallia nealsonii AAU1]|nr:serine/threonine protein kinase [Niallia nealsonii AAU1]